MDWLRVPSSFENPVDEFGSSDAGKVGPLYVFSVDGKAVLYAIYEEYSYCPDGKERHHIFYLDVGSYDLSNYGTGFIKHGSSTYHWNACTNNQDPYSVYYHKGNVQQPPSP